ncbi:hypothetical protein [Paracraurococcus ruber]|nr:hypothetical protein [Paracraurococcus ruber]
MDARILVTTLALLALAACEVSGTRRAGLPGEPLAPSAASPNGAAGAAATGGGVPPRRDAVARTLSLSPAGRPASR